MKNSLEQLTAKDRTVLANFYDTEGYQALRRLIDIERLELAKDHVDKLDLMDIRYLSGQAAGLKRLVGTLKENYDKQNKKS